MDALSGTSSTLEAQYFPPIELSPNKNYVLGLVELLTFNSIPNIDSNNNKFYAVYTLPVGSYEIEDIDKFLRKKLAHDDITFNFKLNNNILRCTIKCAVSIDFRSEDSRVVYWASPDVFSNRTLSIIQTYLLLFSKSTL